MIRHVPYDVVIPTVGRPELKRLLLQLAAEQRRPPRRIVVVDDRSRRRTPLLAGLPPSPQPAVRVIASGGRGPAAARNIGWRACASAWVVFLDDDVVPEPGWATALQRDLRSAAPDVAGVQGRIEVPLPTHRAPTDWERNVAGLSSARWATADMAYRRRALQMVGGFDERFPRAYREDADLALRVLDAGFRLAVGGRRVIHPVRPSRPLDAVRRQAGNADDVLMAALHGARWRRRAGARPGRRRMHLVTSACALGAAATAALGRRRPAIIMAAAWSLLCAEFTWARLRPGPRTLTETWAVVATSPAIPVAASWHWLGGWWRLRSMLRRAPGDRRPEIVAPVEAVLFDRDGTLIADVPYNTDPRQVRPMPGAMRVLGELRRRGVKIGIVTNQSAVGTGLASDEELAAVNQQVEHLLGRFDTWQVCRHAPSAGCRCRKPGPELIEKAAADLGVSVERCVVVGDIGSDVAAARRAGASHVLVPTSATEPAEVAAAEVIAADLDAALDHLLPHLAAGS